MRNTALVVTVVGLVGALHQASAGPDVVPPGDRPRVTPPPPPPPIGDVRITAIIAAKDRCVVPCSGDPDCVVGCDRTATTALEALGLGRPRLISIEPRTVRAGAILTIRGEHLKLGHAPVTITFNSVIQDLGLERTVHVLPASATELTVAVPLDAPPGQVVVSTAYGPTGGEPIRITYPPIEPPPKWTTVTPFKVPPGCQAVIDGVGFEPLDKLIAIAPVGAGSRSWPTATGGRVEITTPSSAHRLPGPVTVTARALRWIAGTIHEAPLSAAVLMTDTPPLAIKPVVHRVPRAGGTIVIPLSAPAVDRCGGPGRVTWGAPFGRGDVGAHAAPAAGAPARTGCWFGLADRTEIRCAIPAQGPDYPRMSISFNGTTRVDAPYE